MVKQIGWLDPPTISTAWSSSCDPIQLVWMVKEIGWLEQENEIDLLFLPQLAAYGGELGKEQEVGAFSSSLPISFTNRTRRLGSN